MGYPILFDTDDIEIITISNIGEIGEGMVQLFKQIFNRDIPLESFIWYETYKGKTIWGFAKSKRMNKYVALYGLLPIELNLRKKFYCGYLCHNVGVIPEYQGKGLFQYIGEHILKSVLREKEIVIGFPNKLSVKGHKRIGWRVEHDMKFFEKRDLIPIDEPDINSIKEISTFPEDVDIFGVEFAASLDFCVKKVSQYLNWRISKPYQSYNAFLYYIDNRIRGYMIYKIFNDTKLNIKKGHIIDIQGASEDIIISLIKKAEQLSSKNRVDLLNVWIYEKSFMADIFRNMGFSVEESKFDYPLIVYTTDTAIDEHINLADQKRFVFSLADNDVY